MPRKNSSSSFGDLLWSCFFSVSSRYSGGFSLLLGVLPWLIEPTDFDLFDKVLWCFLALLFFLVVLGFSCSWKAYSELSSMSLLPRTLLTGEPPKSYGYGISLLVLEPTRFLNFNSLASVFYLREGVEHLVSIGRVINVQEDGKVQLLLFFDKDLDDIIGDLLKNSDELKKKLIVKPSVDYTLLGEV